ncbi:MAG: alpha-ketoglutarate-dependent dioxygenase AlkB [Candidatus Parcubacteria bacterium]|nr:alpha-ketoglutarate-dependent dioxygenase AlkB [Candidatus Paceibacterota bacterium]
MSNSLFSQEEIILKTENSLVTYQSQFLSEQEIASYFGYFLENIDWDNDQAIIYGKKIITKRKIAWFADDGADYNYSGSSRIGKNWDKNLLKIKQKLTLDTGYTVNSCLMNMYHTGMEGMGWHSDDQNHLEPKSAVAIISFGAERWLKLRETSDKTNQKKTLLEQGSLLLMLDQTQKYWQHEIPKMAGVKDIRISLTFRLMKRK